MEGGERGMSRIWKEPYDPERHPDHMYGVEADVDRPGLAPRHAYFVEVAGFTFQFLGLSQLRVALEHYRLPPKGSTRAFSIDGDHWEFQSWQTRLPAKLMRRSHRPRVVRALESALEAFCKGNQ
jgi:hypothetical protein